MKKSSLVKPPWFLRNPQPAPLSAPVPPDPAMAPQHHDLPCPPSMGKGLPGPLWGRAVLGSIIPVPLSLTLGAEQSPDPAWELASPQLALLALHQALSRQGLMEPCTKGLGPIPSLTATQTAGLLQGWEGGSQDTHLEGPLEASRSPSCASWTLKS